MRSLVACRCLLVAPAARAGSDKPDERLAGVRVARANLIERVRASGSVQVVEGQIRPSLTRSQKFSSTDVSRSSAELTLLKPLGGDAFAAVAEMEKLVLALKPPDDTSYRLGDARLAVADPEQVRPELLKAIARDVAKTRESLGPTARVTVSGLEGPVLVRARNASQVELFIEYELAFDLK